MMNYADIGPRVREAIESDDNLRGFISAAAAMTYCRRFSKQNAKKA